MTETQLYIAIGIPTIAVLLGILMNGLLYNALAGRMGSIEARMLALETTFTTRFDLIIGKLADLDTRISVIEDRRSR